MILLLLLLLIIIIIIIIIMMITLILSLSLCGGRHPRLLELPAEGPFPARACPAEARREGSFTGQRP